MWTQEDAWRLLASQSCLNIELQASERTRCHITPALTHTSGKSGTLAFTTASASWQMQCDWLRFTPAAIVCSSPRPSQHGGWYPQTMSQKKPFLPEAAFNGCRAIATRIRTKTRDAVTPQLHRATTTTSLSAHIKSQACSCGGTAMLLGYWQRCAANAKRWAAATR